MNFKSTDAILKDIWRVKDQLAEEYQRDPRAYWAKLRRVENSWIKNSLKSSTVRKKAVKTKTKSNAFRRTKHTPR